MQSEAPDEISFCAWVAQAEPGAAVIYHRGFLAVDAASLISKLTPDQRRALQDLAAAAWRAAEQGLVHLVQERLAPDRFAYLAIARSRSTTPIKPIAERLLPAA